ncbi:purine and uridine phosphorylase [Cristinia sonorae]|uniref:Purine and uridine phosphorylase n=1 Tax=Cristinia sonorae TaxID=1940300 RepID=A0A8K0UI24_9AGAR|nr:purine and uridine phosphorylase [Cristinia sonorae]
MKNLIVDANFPRTLDERVYHLGIKAGEVANRIVTVGAPSRAERIATYLDSSPKPFVLNTERGFLTITGRYKGVPVSIVSIGMGSPNMDFFVREARECLNGDLVVVRLGSCGALIDVKVGAVVVPKASIAVNRNYDFDFVNGSSNQEDPYRVSKPVAADVELSALLKDTFERTREPVIQSEIVSGTLNASTDSFYSSQGRITSFPDHNADIIDKLKASHSNLATFEMETFHLFHLAASWPTRERPSQVATAPISSVAAGRSIAEPGTAAHQEVPSTVESSAQDGHVLVPQPRIRAAAAQMVFAARGSRDFITPEQVSVLENWCAVAVLESLASFKIEPERLHSEVGSVWEVKA